MSDYAVIVQNDESQWDDIKGDLYHYPNGYKSILTPGCKAVYYKGRIKSSRYAPARLSNEPHYFGIGTIGDSILDPDSKKKDRYCEILDYREFKEPILAKQNGIYLEPIPESRKSNYWRNGVREIAEDTYRKIVELTELTTREIELPSLGGELESTAPIEGKKVARYSTHYERNPFYRARAIEIHGLSCMVCGFNFEEKFGELGTGFIHVHHNKPLSESSPKKLDPRTDMSVVCPNCHAMIHRKKNATQSITQLRFILQNQV